MKILHHFDDDGRCAAAIIYKFCSDPYSVQMGSSDFYEYQHGQDFDKLTENLTFNENESVYIVDLALDDVIMNFIRKAYLSGCFIYHLDHHETSLERMKKLTDDEKKIMKSDHVRYIHDSEVSGCMLSYLFSCMTLEERTSADCMNNMYDFSDDYSHIKITYKGNSREYGVPMAIRYIDDNDVWRHQNVETKFFCLGFGMEKDKRPYDFIWDKLLSGAGDDYRLIDKYINAGKTIWEYQNRQNNILMKNAFVAKMQNLNVLCVNSCTGNSRIFGNAFDKYDAVCKFGYDGAERKWRYTMYCSDVRDPDKKIDLSKIAAYYGGGGHKHAAGFTLNYNLFDDHRR